MKLLNLIDIFRILHPQVKQFTRYQKNPVIGSRLDYFLVSKTLSLKIKNCDIIPGINSDHKLVTLNLNHTSIARGRGYWKFNNELLLNEDYVSKTKASIFLDNNVASDTTAHVRWDALKCYMRGHTTSYCSIQKKNVS